MESFKPKFVDIIDSIQFKFVDIIDSMSDKEKSTENPITNYDCDHAD